jgi:enediyne biosynthesis protein E8
VPVDSPDDEHDVTMTLEAFADTIIPGALRFAGDRAVAGASPDGGAVVAGALELLRDPAVGLVGALDSLVLALNEHARSWAAARDLVLDGDVPPFVALRFTDRTGLVDALTQPDHPEKDMWVALAIFSTMAYDCAAHLHTADAVAAGHVGLTAMGFAKPEPDGLWRFPQFSYRRPLASLHPNTTPSGSPA